MMELEMNEVRMKKQLAEIDAETNEKLAKVQQAKEAPINETACFDQWIDKEERIDEQLAEVDCTIHITRKAIEEYRTGLGQRLRQGPDEIVDVEFAEVPAPAREEAVDPTEPACKTAIRAASTEPMTASSVAELPSPAPAKSNGGAPINSDPPAPSASPPSNGAAEEQ